MLNGFAQRDPKLTYEVEAKSAKEHFESSEYFATVAATRTELEELKEDALGDKFDLWYLRIQSLLILQQGQQAAEEISKNLKVLDEDLPLSAGDRLKAWRLRVLTVPVKTKGVNQSAVQQYYNLASEARASAKVLPENSNSQKQWLECIEIAGQYALSTLIAIKDYESAINLLQIHYQANPKQIYLILLSLLHISIGDTLGARPYINFTNTKEQQKLNELSKFVDEDSREIETHVLSGIKDLFEGNLDLAIKNLESKVLNERTHNNLLLTTSITNLTLLYDLCYADPTPYYSELRQKLKGAKFESTDRVVQKLLL